MKICVIVVTYNGVRWIEKCFNSLINSDVPLDVLAIDNASTDGTPEIIRKLYPKIQLIETGQNLGFGKANNIGFIQAKKNNADYVFLLNQDAWIEPDTIVKLIEISQQRPEFGILSPLHMNGTGSALDLNFADYINPEKCPNLISDAFVKNIGDIYESKYVNAAAWLLTNNCVNKVGGFDPIFPHYGEDDDYLNRTGFHKLKIGIVPHAKIYHDRICNSTAEPYLNQKKLIISNIAKLKRYPNSFQFNLVMLLKEQFDMLTSLIILRDFINFKTRLKALIKTLPMINRIRRSKEFFSKENSTILTSENQI